MPSNIKLSGLVVAHNEEEVIEACLASLSFCDEIIVCLDRCTDGTKKIAEKYATKILEGSEKESWHIEGVRRMAGIDACKGKWIFELDADERASEELSEEIATIVADGKESKEPASGETTSGSAISGFYLVPVDNYVGERLVKHGWGGSFGTSAVARLFTKGSKTWGMERVHPKVTLGKKLGKLGAPIVHLVDKDIDDMIDRLQRYSTAQAEDLLSKNQKLPHFASTLRKALSRFYKSYLARKGYKEGTMGFLLAIMAALMPILAHLKAAEKKNRDLLS